ncbi:ABC transporter ATP-binding protein [Streptomyces daqingensis]|jgi:ABC-2 type transport system ATP-binding protein|uniref:ABC transporter ATP-binding protein n=1 Tax=Streptomyces daqingensis TaxID=1472640 RepID=A0ABQ2MCI3_9ACTN|nr:ABC transporter ATP-binding protein [Streptomyces daqingensis]GGO48603.1 ABC transporter ATP-binding protein [Streptomyces daqingensis]
MTDQTAAVEAVDLRMRYGFRSGTVLDGCSFRLPAGSISALVGPNGAGKSTLLAIAAGLRRPTGGTVRLLGGVPGENRERVAFVAQNKPLYPQLTVAGTLRLGAELNPGRWDQDAAENIAYGGGAEPKAAVRKLSGGQRTRVALALAFGKRPELMLLDEPMADLDPLARHQLTGALMAQAAEHGTSIVMSSHVVAELESCCDHLLLLSSGRVQLGGTCDEIVEAHSRLTGTGEDFGSHEVVEEQGSGRGRTALVRPDGKPDTGVWDVEQPSLEEIFLAHLRNPAAPALVTGSVAPATSAREAAI